MIDKKLYGRCNMGRGTSRVQHAGERLRKGGSNLRNRALPRFIYTLTNKIPRQLKLHLIREVVFKEYAAN